MVYKSFADELDRMDGGLISPSSSMSPAGRGASQQNTASLSSANSNFSTAVAQTVEKIQSTMPQGSNWQATQKLNNSEAATGVTQTRQETTAKMGDAQQNLQTIGKMKADLAKAENAAGPQGAAGGGVTVPGMATDAMITAGISAINPVAGVMYGAMSAAKDIGGLIGQGTFGSPGTAEAVMDEASRKDPQARHDMEPKGQQYMDTSQALFNDMAEGPGFGKKPSLDQSEIDFAGDSLGGIAHARMQLDSVEMSYHNQMRDGFDAGQILEGREANGVQITPDNVHMARQMGIDPQSQFTMSGAMA